MLSGPLWSQELVRLSDLKKSPISFWFLCVACLTFYGTISSFLTLAHQYFKSEFGRTSYQADRLLCLVYSVSAAVSPLLGLLLDRLGKNLTCIMVAVLLWLESYIMVQSFIIQLIQLSLTFMQQLK